MQKGIKCYPSKQDTHSQFLSTHLGGVIKFTVEPPDPSYARNGSNAKLVWDYSVDNKQAELEGIRYSAESNGKFNVILVLTNTGTVLNLPNIPAAYNGRVRIEGRASLVIENINLQDNTQFKCTLVAKFGGDLVSIVQLIVTGTYYLKFVLIIQVRIYMIYLEDSSYSVIVRVRDYHTVVCD